jgi:tRNA pseudouridine38-40 synthase
VQQRLEEALTTLLRIPIEVTAAGRTDAGVHALIQVVHFDVYDADLVHCVLLVAEAFDKIVFKLNAILPWDIAVQQIRPIEPDFHARFSATYRAYQYKVHQLKSPFENHASWYMRRPLDLDLMNQAAALLINHTDFECFSKVHTEVNNFRCTVQVAYWQPEAVQGTYTFHIKANRFLRGMVRAIVGTMIEVGHHKQDLNGFQEVLNSQDRGKAGSAAPPHGLYLSEIGY